MDTVFARKALDLREDGHQWVLLGEWNKATQAPVGNALQIKSPDSISSNRSFMRLVESCDIWVIHRFYPQMQRIIRKFRGQKVIALQTWGPDYMRFYGGLDRFLLPETISIVSEQKRPRGVVRKSRVWRKASEVKQAWLAKKARDCIGGLDSIHFCLPVEADDPAISEICEQKRSRLRFNYGALPPFRNAERSVEGGGAVVLVGNSLDPTNNHVEAFRLVSRNIGLVKKVLVPVSYGGPPSYLAALERIAVALFGDKVVFMKDFMPIDEFRSVLEQCDVVVLNHLRQQAVGAYIEAVCAGCSVVLNPEGALWKWSLDAGVFCYDTSEMEVAFRHRNESSAVNYSVVSRYFDAGANGRFYSHLNALWRKSGVR